MTSTIITGKTIQSQIWYRLREYAFSTDHGKLDGKSTQFMIEGGKWQVFVNLTSGAVKLPHLKLSVPPNCMYAQSGGLFSKKPQGIFVSQTEDRRSVGELDLLSRLRDDLDRACHKTRG